MDVKRRIALLVSSQGTRRTADDLDMVGKSSKKVGDETERAGRKMKVADAHAQAFQRRMRGVASAAKVGAVGLAAVTVAVGAHAVGEFRESYKAMRQTDAVIRSTGGAAKVTAKDVGDLANSISLKAGIDDEAIQAGENMLLTFTKIRNEAGKGNDVFNQATQAATDMSVAMGKDLKGSAMAVGKALNDPVKGMAALGRVGVQFSADQKKQVAGWVKQGDTLRAQKFILRELNKEFGGSAKAQADPMDKATVAVNNLAEAFGYLIGPPLMKAATAAANFVGQMSEGRGAGGQFRRVLVGVGEKIGDVAGKVVAAGRKVVDLYHAFKQGKVGAVVLVAAIAGLVAAIATFKILHTIIGLVKAARVAMLAFNGALLANPAVLVAAVIIGIGVALVIAYKKIGWFRRAVQNTWGWIKDHWPLLLSILTGPVGAAVIYIVRHWDKIVGFFRRMPGRIRRAVSGMWDGVKDGFRSAVNWIIGKWNSLEFHIGGQKIAGKEVIPSVTIGTPDIPMLATGGVVRGAGRWITGERGAEINESDGRGTVKVTPLADHAPAVSMFGGTNGRAFARMLAEEIANNPPVIELDGKPIAANTRRHALRAAAARSPA